MAAANAYDPSNTDATTPPRGFMAVGMSPPPAAPEVAGPSYGSDTAEQAVSVAMSVAQQNCDDAGLC